MYSNNRLKGLISMNIDKNILEVPIEDIIPNRFQPRLAFNEEGINELAESIKQHGIIQPLVVRQLGDKYEIIAGERRYKASTMAGLAKVPVIISDIDDNKSAEVALVENIQRRNLTAIEEAKSYKNLLDRGYLTQEQLANKMGVSQSSIANKLRLLNLDEEVQEALLNEKISERHARALLTLESHEDQKKWLKRVMEERLTVRQLDLELKKLQENGGEEEEGIPLVNINPNLDEIVTHAEDIHVERAPHDVASMLIPEGGIPLEETKEPVKSPNKFFNFLEDEQANMSVIEPEEILNTFTSTPILEPSIEESTNESKEMESQKEEQSTTPSLENMTEIPIIEEVKPIVEETNNDFDTIELLEELNPEVKETNLTEQIVEPQEKTSTILESVIPTTLEQPQVEAEKESTLDEKTTSIEETTPVENVNEEISLESLIEPIYMEEPKKEENNVPVIEENQEVTSPIIEPISTETPIVIEEQATEPNLVVAPQEESLNTSIIEEPIVEITNDQIVEEPTTEELKPFKSIFFNSDEDDEEASTPVETPIINNTIEEVEPVIEEPLVDPLDSIVTLEPDYQQRQEELAGRDLKTAINVVRDTIVDLERRGFVVECEEADLEDIYHITIKIDKNNK